MTEINAREECSRSAHPGEAQRQGWIDAVLIVAAHYRIGISAERLRIDLAWDQGRAPLRRLARSAGLLIEATSSQIGGLSSLRLPLVAEFINGDIAVVEAETATGYNVRFVTEGGLVTPVLTEDLRRRVKHLYALRPATATADRRIDEYIKPWRPDWLRRIVLSDLRPYRSVLLASLAANVLSLAGILFSMQVYDRVIPAQSLTTLNVLFAGVAIAMFFALLIKIARSRITDIAGKSADLRVSDRVFGHALRVRNTARPRATGTFIAQIKELEHVREILTSTTVAAVADVPFFLLFCALFYYIAGPLIWIPLAAVGLLLVPALLAQGRLRRLAEESSRESSLRNAMLVEAIQGLDDIKTLQAEPRFQNLWNHYNEVTSGASMRLRDLINRLTNWAQTVQGAVFALVVFFGAPLVMAGEMSTGVLVAASMLSSRMIAPLASVSQILNRWQQARVAREALDKLLALPVDAPAERQPIRKAVIQGDFQLQNAQFGHDGKTTALKVDSLKVMGGERIAILGRNGAGKSTLLSGLAGLIEPIGGEVRIDGIAMHLVDPADLRRDIGHLGQGARLFHGTLRENLIMGAPAAGDHQIMEVLDDLNLGDFVRHLEEGLDHLIEEGGRGLSGGQCQGLILARLLLREPRVLLLDEPTAALDEVSEQAVIARLMALPEECSVIVATHRPALLRLVDRLIVVHNGNVVMDGPKAQVIAQLRAGKEAA